MQLYTILARLLDYPDEELMEHLSLIIELLERDSQVSDQEQETIGQLIAWQQQQGLLKLQQNYVDTFDMTAEHDLHLTHHLFGDDRGRGPALVDLSEHFKSAGLEVKGKEIPDYLPLLLEYASILDEAPAQLFLSDANKVLVVLAANLKKANSPYAPLIQIIVNRGLIARAA